MKTSLIRYRVADFLSQSPPFDTVGQDDLLVLAASGRVSFHESEEFVFRQGQAPRPCLWVIQQGTVEIIDESPEGPRLRDLLESGDVLGLDGLLGRAGYACSARTASDVILYSVDAAVFKAQLDRYPDVAAYLASHGSLWAHHRQKAAAARRGGASSGASFWLDASEPPEDFLRSRLQTARPSETVGSVLRQTANSPEFAIAVVDGSGAPLGVITDRELRTCWESREGGAPDTCGNVMTTDFRTAPAGLTVHDRLLDMMQNRVSQLVITQDGSPASVVQALLCDTDLALRIGCNPVRLLHELLAARSPAQWRVLLGHVRELKSAALTGSQADDRLAALSCLWDRAYAESVVKTAVSEVSAEDGTSAEAWACCWLLFGSAGRSENFDPVMPELGVVYADGLRVPGAEADEHFRRVGQRIASLLVESGLRPLRLSADEAAAPRFSSLSAWRAFFDGVISNPVENGVYAARRLFDIEVLFGDPALAGALETSVLQAMSASRPFVPVLANDTMDHLPPMTFFQGLVIDSDGAQAETLDLDALALGPIVDAARVHALACGSMQAKSTLQRLELAARACPQGIEVFREAGAAFRVVSRHATLAAMKHPLGRPVVEPGQLSKVDQNILKASFRSIQSLIEFTATPASWMRGP
jgi:CBS domain-containing protein